MSLAATSESEVESLKRAAGSSGEKRRKVPEPVRDWRPRDAFETAEGFVAHAVRYLVSKWSSWLQDGTLKSSSYACANPSVGTAILSETNLAEAFRGVEVFCERLSLREVPADLCRHLEEFCNCTGSREYVQANKAYMEIVMGSRKWQSDVPYLVDGNRNGPSVVQNVAERLNKKMENPLDVAGIRDHTVLLRRLLTVAQAALPNDDPSKNNG